MTRSDDEMKNYAIILAAGKGTRMKSELPKVMHPICGLPMIEYLVRNLEKLKIDEIYVVVGHKKEMIKDYLGDRVVFVEQNEQLGTGHAVMQVSPFLNEKKGSTMVLTGDTPLLEAETLRQFMIQHFETGSDATVLSSNQENPTGYGRIVRSELGFIDRIIEEKDATLEEKTIREVNSGIYIFNNEKLFSHIGELTTKNAQKEYYLTDMVEVFNHHHFSVEPFVVKNNTEVLGINDRLQLSQAEGFLRERINRKHMLNGVRLIDPNTAYIDYDVKIEPDAVIYPSVILKGETKIGTSAFIGQNCEIINSSIGMHTSIKQSVVSDSNIGNYVSVGPFAHIRPNSEISDECRIGNFVETKNSSFGKGSKASHLSYIGDAKIGEKVNLGCGSITVNYDGKKKYKTIIGDGSFVGCNVNLIAPVELGKNTLIAAGSTITDDVPDDSLAIARERQTNKENYQKKAVD
jgi:bifunctional UDP-N-acetylglucosamine pyrophosphorylase/glucosamine-1-phosphate N-acetyltransferase